MMKVSYKEYTGVLMRIEIIAGDYDLEIYDEEREVTYKFEGIDCKDVVFGE